MDTMPAARARQGAKVPIPAIPPAAALDQFMAKYSPAIAEEGRAALATLRRLAPGAVEMVYDNYNFLVVGFGPTERASEAVFSLAFASRWLTLCFLQDGPSLPDPDGLLRGSGSQVRHVRLTSAADLTSVPIKALLTAALSAADVPIDRRQPSRLIIKSISAKQRPRRPRP